MGASPWSQPSCHIQIAAASPGSPPSNSAASASACSQLMPGRRQSTATDPRPRSRSSQPASAAVTDSALI